MDCETVERDNIPERYLAGTLDPALKEQWELHYFGCDRCAGLLATWQAIDQPLRGMAASIRQEIRPRKPVGRWLWAGAAVAAALLVGFGIRWMRPTAAPVQTEIAVKPPAVNPFIELARLDPPAYQPSTLRAARSSEEVQFEKAMDFYLKRDYPGAIPGLQAALALNPDAAAPRFFLGACELLTGDATGSVRDLQKVASGDSPFAPEAQFDLAKAYLQQGEKAQAQDALRKLTDGPGDFQVSARQLLDRIAAVQ